MGLQAAARKTRSKTAAAEKEELEDEQAAPQKSHASNGLTGRLSTVFEDTKAGWAYACYAAVAALDNMHELQFSKHLSKSVV